jgi:hypothetical protein
LVGGLLGGAAILSGAAVADAKKGGKGKGKKKGHGKGKGKAKGRTKVFICHKSGGDFELIRVGAPAVKGHSKHGDQVCGEPGVCQTGDPTGCGEDGACTFALADEGTECTTEEGADGTCDAAGVCVATPVCGGAGDTCELDDDCCEGLACSAQSVCAAV